MGFMWTDSNLPGLWHLLPSLILKGRIHRSFMSQGNKTKSPKLRNQFSSALLKQVIWSSEQLILCSACQVELSSHISFLFWIGFSSSGESPEKQKRNGKMSWSSVFSIFCRLSRSEVYLSVEKPTVYTLLRGRAEPRAVRPWSSGPWWPRGAQGNKQHWVWRLVLHRASFCPLFLLIKPQEQKGVMFPNTVVVLVCGPASCCFSRGWCSPSGLLLLSLCPQTCLRVSSLKIRGSAQHDISHSAFDLFSSLRPQWVQSCPSFSYNIFTFTLDMSLNPNQTK